MEDDQVGEGCLYHGRNQTSTMVEIAIFVVEVVEK
jgi:hypothetical protein